MNSQRNINKSKTQVLHRRRLFVAILFRTVNNSSYHRFNLIHARINELSAEICF